MCVCVYTHIAKGGATDAHLAGVTAFVYAVRYSIYNPFEWVLHRELSCII